ncbi:MAG: cupin domain-containing protein [Thermomicrobiales bacterium]
MPYRRIGIPETFAVLSGPNPPDDAGFRSNRLQILGNSRDTPWSDPDMHMHTEGDEAYLVLEGSITLLIEDERVRVSAGEVCFVAAGTFHALIDVTPPYRGFVIRAPAIDDKVSRPYDPPIGT